MLLHHSADLVDKLRRFAVDEGFVSFGICPAVDSQGFSDLVRWIESGYAGEMTYFDDRKDAYRNPSGVMQGARSIIALAYPYPTSSAGEVSCGNGRVARYAWTGDDYHDVIHPKLKRLCKLIGLTVPHSNSRGVVDTAPLMEREIAQLAGLGWRGKNTLLLNKGLGSYFFLACILTDVDLPTDAAHPTDHCGTCTACLDACPTAAFPSPGVLDATRCISYLTIEHRGAIDVLLRDGIGDWLFGCDVCQEVCPWNRKPARKATTLDIRFDSLDLSDCFDWDEDEFRSRFRNTPIWRTRRRGILRNAAIVLGNQGKKESISVLAKGLFDEEPIVRGACTWAIGKIGGTEATRLLQMQSKSESDTMVREEIARWITLI